MSVRLRELSRRLGGTLAAGGCDVEIDALARPGIASDRELSYVVPGRALPADCRAAAVLVGPGVVVREANSAFLAVDDLYVALSRATAWLPVRRSCGATRGIRSPAVHPSARVSARAVVSPGACIGEFSEVAAGAILGEDVVIGAYCSIGAGAVVEGPVVIGNRCHIGPGTVVGTDGFAFVEEQGRWHRMPRFGGVRIGDDVTILSQSTVHAGIFGDTQIGDRCALDSQVLIGHDSRLGADSAIAGHTAVAGAATIGRGVRIGGKAGIGEGVFIADGVTVTGMSMVSRSIRAPGARVSSGWPAEPSGQWWRRVARLRRLGSGGSGAGEDDGPGTTGD